MSLMADLSNSHAKRSKSATKLAEYILQKPERVISMSIATLANQVGVSEPTVNRFCTALGLKGFPDFKLNLAGELARNRPNIFRGIESGDTTSHVVSKIFESTRASLTATEDRIDTGSVDRAVEMLSNARSILLCGLGASASVALDAQHKLLRFGTPVIAHTDMINQRMTAASLKPDDCLVCISYTGRTKAMIEVAQLGRTANAMIIGITGPDSPLAEQCHVVLKVEGDEDTELYTPMTSRLSQLVLIDVLATNLALQKGPAFAEHLRQVKQSLVTTRKNN